jgi:hypothetical protein
MCEFNEAVKPVFEVAKAVNPRGGKFHYYARRNGGVFVRVTARQFAGLVRQGAQEVAK